MSRLCTVCEHPKRQEIDRALVEGTPAFRIAKKHTLARSSVQRHKDEHLTEKLAKAATIREGREALEAVDLICVAREMLTKLQQLAENAEAKDDIRGAVAAIGKIPDFLRILGEIEGQLRAHGSINVAITPEWSALRTVILSALEPYPDAVGAVVAALEHVPAAGNA